ncbi:methyltransferase [Bermanella marisrubri]|uniref:tRNA1(Val) (adenine(37)-N6)-methyltransferase n=1 Tax=Bermanella marisrubri TaxID=207949 RepID=Q1N2Q4_9GAMM|nr:methyltransferase [Bermanella marisrubri]EAT12615.1 hypothetical protein RED65_06958 [Oceanobacter sp. RED65] [Bermanella marisrubri]QIZ84833.1 methyltransferase [Bermanella marisrubri]
MSQFHFKQFSIVQTNSAMKVTLDACLFAAYIARESSAPEYVLDLGMGTGVLGLMLAQAFDAHITGIELDSDACRDAHTNIEASPFSNRVRVLQADIRQWRDTRRSDLIVSNPPFFTAHLANPNKQKAMARHNNHLPFSELVGSIQRHLHPNGEAWLLLPRSELHALEACLEKTDLTVHTVVYVRSKTTKPPHRVFVCLTFEKKRSNNDDQDVKEDHICIHNNSGYDEKFIELLKPYYLKL